MLVISSTKTAGNGAKKNIPWDYHGMSNIPGGDEGIRTLDTLAGIPHFQCGALDQLCDISVSGYSAFASSAEITPGSLSSKAASNSASISRNNGSSLPTSREASPSATVGVSLYD